MDKEAGKDRTLKRGDIYYANLSGIEQSCGSEQKGRRPVIIIQNDAGNRYAPTTIVAIMTTRHKKRLPTHVRLRKIGGLKCAGIICLEQIKTIDKSRLEQYLGNVGEKAMQKIEKAIMVSLGMGRQMKAPFLIRQHLDN
ncbi:MAG: type II toxin-antitoxin system PemK/MazF family toxin [Lachnospiraceae bacterium]|nr:type II toxin-antitoxin system PemK/MazF family toxin [Lachnospiraceae bacterium]